MESHRLIETEQSGSEKGRNSLFHYGWIIVAGCSAAMLTFSFSRGTLPLVLRPMRENLGLSLAQMGIITSGHFVAYTLMSMIWGVIADRYGGRKVLTIGSTICGVFLICMGYATSFLPALICYVGTGIGASAMLVTAIATLSNWFSRSRRGRATSMIFLGSSLVMTILGILVPKILIAYSWRSVWWLVGIITFLSAAVCFALIRDTPASKGLAPIGESNIPRKTRSNGPIGTKSQLKVDSKRAETRIGWRGVWRMGTVWNLGVIYFGWGISEIIFQTFRVDHLLGIGFTYEMAGATVSLGGVLSIVSPILWGVTSDYFPRKYVLMTAVAIQAASIYVFACSMYPPTIFAATITTNLSISGFFAVFAATPADYFDSRTAGTVFGLLTFIFGLAAITAPTIGGFMFDITGSYWATLLTAVFGDVVAFVAVFMLKRPE